MNTNKNKGITLIALIITIVLLLILATVTIVEVKETKIFGRAKKGAKEYRNAQIDEQNKMDKWANDVDIWVNGKSGSASGGVKPGEKPGEKPVDKPGEKPGEKPNPGETQEKPKPEKLKIGDYVEYDVTYKNMYQGIQFTKENGWRVLDPGTINSEGKYDNVKIISTGIPAMLGYYVSGILDGTGEKDSYAWKPTAEELAEYKKKVPYYNAESDEGVTAAAGLYYHADKIQILQSDDNNIKTGKGWLGEIYKEGNKITEEKSLGEIILIKGIGKKIEYPTLEIIKGTLKPREGRNFQENTDKDVLKPNNKFTKEEDAAKGFWNLQDLKIPGYEQLENGNGWGYWIASPDSDHTYRLRLMSYSGSDGDITSLGNWYYGLRPIVSLESNISLKKSTFQGVN